MSSKTKFRQKNIAEGQKKTQQLQNDDYLNDDYLYDDDIIETFSNQKKSFITPVAIVISIAALLFSTAILFQLFSSTNDTPVISVQGNYVENVKPLQYPNDTNLPISLTDKLISDQEIEIRKITPNPLEIREIPISQNDIINNIIPKQNQTIIGLNAIELPEALKPNKKHYKIIAKLLSENIIQQKTEQKKNLLKLREINNLEKEKKIANIIKNIEIVKNIKIIKNIKIPDIKQKGGNIKLENGFYVQLAAHRTVQEASKEISRIKKSGGGLLLQRYRYQIVKKNIRNKGVFHTIRIGDFSSKNEATQLCKQIKTKGISDCFVPNLKS